MSTCKKCGMEKSPRGHCAPCSAEKTRRWRANNPGRAREIEKRSRVKNASKARARASAWYLANSEYAKQKMAQRRKEKPDVVKSEKLMASFGLTLEQYQNMEREQSFRCAICEEDQTGSKKKMAVDHHHGTGQIRALLCHNCNVGLGNFKESVQTLIKAINYIHEHTTTKN